MTHHTNKINKDVFPQGSRTGQKLKFRNLQDVHRDQNGAVLDDAFYTPVLYNPDECETGKGILELTNRESTVPLGNGKILRVLDPNSPKPSVFQSLLPSSMKNLRDLMYAGVVCIGLALILAAVTYFFPKLFGGSLKMAGYAVMLLLTVGVVLVILDRSDTF